MNKNILFIGYLYKGSTALHRLTALKKNTDIVYAIDLQILKNKIICFIDRVISNIFRISINSWLLKNKIIEKVSKINPEIIWVDKGIIIPSSTFKIIKMRFSKIIMIHYSPDDMMNPRNQTKYYLDCIPLYDLHVTTKSYNVDELYNIGARSVLFVNNAFAPEIHKPYQLTEEEVKKFSSDVSFIGSIEKERAEIIFWLAENGIKITVWGKNWQPVLKKHKNIRLISNWFADEKYAKIICATKINLAFLRKVNRDLQTTRTTEIPACGGFMLAERTDEHLKLFKENEEAVFFSDNDELKRKIEYYLSNENERIKIALNGYRKCTSAGYDNITMVKKVIGSL